MGEYSVILLEGGPHNGMTYRCVGDPPAELRLQLPATVGTLHPWHREERAIYVLEEAGTYRYRETLVVKVKRKKQKPGTGLGRPRR